MRIAKTIDDVHDLLADYDAVLELREGGTITVRFPMIEKYESKGTPDIMPVRTGADGMPISDTAGINRNRHARNVIRDLTSSPQFWRVTTVADQLTQFKRVAGAEHGLVKITKKGGQPLTLHFDTELRAGLFMAKFT